MVRNCIPGATARKVPALLNLLRLLLIRFFRLTGVVCHAHAAQHVIGKEELSIRWHHHDLQLIGEPFGHDLVNQQRPR